MAVVNTTYNFNQPNMNFGQALLYGAFGSLTGGMGMYGGYGMGMGGSLFSMMGMGMGGYGCGFGGYGIGGYSDSYAGMQLGNAFAGIALNCLTQAIGGGRGGSSKQTISSQIDDVESNAKTHLDILNKNGKTYSLDNYDFKNAKAEESYDTEIASAESAITEKLDSLKLNKLGDKPTTVELKDGEDANSSTYKERLAAAQTKWKETKAKLDAEIKILTDKTDTSNELVKKLTEAKEAKANREAEIKTAIDALKLLKTEYDKLIAEQKKENEAQIYDDADGNWLNRASKSSIEKYNGGECTKAQVRKAFNLFIEAKNSGNTNDAKNWANKIVTMHKNNENLFDNNFATAYKQVKSWLDDNQ